MSGTLGKRADGLIDLANIVDRNDNLLRSCDRGSILLFRQHFWQFFMSAFNSYQVDDRVTNTPPKICRRQNNMLSGLSPKTNKHILNNIRRIRRTYFSNDHTFKTLPLSPVKSIYLVRLCVHSKPQSVMGNTAIKLYLCLYKT